MPSIESVFKWEFTSTGAGKAFNCKGYDRQLTMGYETSPGCTALISLQHRMGSSAGPYSTLSTGSVSSGGFATAKALGPHEWIRPYVTDKTANSTNVVTVYLLSN